MVHVRAGESTPAGNEVLVARGALALVGGPERAADLPDDSGTRADPEASGCPAQRDQVAEPQALSWE